jgi:opacity protein-like surface antigen
MLLSLTNIIKYKGFLGMARIAVYLLTSVILLTSNISFAEDIKGLYAKVDAGASIPKGSNASFKTNPVYSIGIGYHFNDMFRTDLNLQYRPITITKSLEARKATNYAAVLNGYLNLSDSQDDVIPYLTVGIGYGKNKLSSFNSSSTNGATIVQSRKTGDDVMPGFSSSTNGATTATIVQSGKTANNVMLNAGAGITIAIINNLRVDIGYRYYNLGKLKGQTTLSATGEDTVTRPYKMKSLTANEITDGLTYKF